MLVMLLLVVVVVLLLCLGYRYCRASPLRSICPYSLSACCMGENACPPGDTLAQLWFVSKNNKKLLF